MKSKFFALLFLLAFASAGAYSQNSAMLEGSIRDGETQEALAGVKVYLIGTTNGAYSAEDGSYVVLGIKPGTYDILFSYMGYNPDTIKGVKISAEGPNVLDKKLGGQVEMKGIEISAERTIVSEVSLLKDIQGSKEVVVGISSEQIGKTQDRDASEIMKRVPGVTIIDNRFVMVRGLSQRYNQVMLNGAFAPSIEADAKSFSFDLIPSSAIDRMMIYKTPSAELPGEFAGGMIKVFTRNIPEHNSFLVNVSSSARGNTTFGDFYQQENEGRTFIGLGTQGLDNLSAIPADLNMVKNPDSIQYYGRIMPKNWGNSLITALPDQRIQLAFNRRFNLKNDVVLGNLTTLTYSNTRATQHISRFDYDEPFNSEKQRHDTLFKYEDAQYTRTAKLGALFNWALKVNSDHKIEFRNLFNLTSMDQATLRSGFEFDADEFMKSDAYYMLNRGIYTSQLSGGHDLFEDKTRIEWVASYSHSFRNEPDFRRTMTSRNNGAAEDEPFETDIQFSPDPRYLGRFYSRMKEQSYFGSVGIDQAVKIGELEPHILAGFLGEYREREFSSRTLAYYAANFFSFNWGMTHTSVDSMLGNDGNIQNSTGLTLGEGTKLSDSYSASNRLLCGYLALDWKFKKVVRLNAGIRYEQNTQTLNSFDNNNDTVTVNNIIPNLLPSFNLAFNLSEKMILRGTGGVTVNRPEFREIAPFTFFDFNQSIIFGGNPSLLTPRIYNFDIRYEVYPSPSEMITLGVFYKRFHNSIESMINPGSTSRPFTFTFGNAPQAYSAGVEIEARKSLAFLNAPVVRDLSVVANASFLKSEVLFPDSVAFISASRPLQGQSPYIINGGLYYNHDSLGLQISLLYNVIGKRISVVGFRGYDDIWEMPRNLLDFSITKRVGKFLSIRGGIQDILNQPIVLIQDSDKDNQLKLNSNDQVIAKTKPGPYYTLGLQFKF